MSKSLSRFCPSYHRPTLPVAHSRAVHDFNAQHDLADVNGFTLSGYAPEGRAALPFADGRLPAAAAEAAPEPPTVEGEGQRGGAPDGARATRGVAEVAQRLRRTLGALEQLALRPRGEGEN